MPWHRSRLVAMIDAVAAILPSFVCAIFRRVGAMRFPNVALHQQLPSGGPRDGIRQQVQIDQLQLAEEIIPITRHWQQVHVTGGTGMTMTVLASWRPLFLSGVHDYCGVGIELALGTP